MYASLTLLLRFPQLTTAAIQAKARLNQQATDSRATPSSTTFIALAQSSRYLLIPMVDPDGCRLREV